MADGEVGRPHCVTEVAIQGQFLRWEVVLEDGWDKMDSERKGENGEAYKPTFLFSHF